MKGKILFFVAGTFTGFLLVIVLGFTLVPKNMFVVQESKYAFNETVEEIMRSAGENNWTVPHVYDLQATMKKNGFEVKPVKVFSLCKPEHAYQILSDESERFVSALMPCRVAVYEKNGKTWVSMMNPGLFSELLGKKTGEVMEAATLENRKILQSVLKQD